VCPNVLLWQGSHLDGLYGVLANLPPRPEETRGRPLLSGDRFRVAAYMRLSIERIVPPKPTWLAQKGETFCATGLSRRRYAAG